MDNNWLLNKCENKFKRTKYFSRINGREFTFTDFAFLLEVLTYCLKKKRTLNN